jgi:phage FluMu protein Com
MDDDLTTDPSAEQMLDGNAVAGALASLFGTEMTAVPGRCAHCGAMHAVAELHAFTRAPGTVLRCPTCHGVNLRMVETAEATYLDARGVAFLRFEHRTG